MSHWWQSVVPALTMDRIRELPEAGSAIWPLAVVQIGNSCRKLCNLLRRNRMGEVVSLVQVALRRRR